LALEKSRAFLLRNAANFGDPKRTKRGFRGKTIVFPLSAQLASLRKEKEQRARRASVEGKPSGFSLKESRSHPFTVDAGRPERGEPNFFKIICNNFASFCILYSRGLQADKD